MVGSFMKWVSNRNAAFVAFLISLLLSALAIFDRAVITKDGAFYVYIAERVTSDGFSAAFKFFNWPWYSISIAAVHNFIGLPHDIIAYAFSIIYMAGLSFFIVKIVEKYDVNARWWACLLVLSIPVYNEFRGELVRETGFWFFLVLSLWFVIGNRKVLNGLFFQISLSAAALYRLEAIFLFFPVLCYFSLLRVELRNKILVILSYSFLFLIASVCSVLYLIFFDGELGSRVAGYLKLINPMIFLDSIGAKANIFAEAALRRWSYKDAPLILVSGIFVSLLWRVTLYAGLSSSFVLFKTGRESLLRGLKAEPLFICSALAYFFVLFVFYIQMGFVNSRYSAALLLILTPSLSLAAYYFLEGKVKLKILFVLFSLLFCLDNIVSIGDKKYYYKEAADWVATNTSVDDSILYDDPRIAYYAEREWPSNSPKFDFVMAQGLEKSYDFLMVDLKKNEGFGDEFLSRFDVITSFSSKKRTLHILKNK